jgi:DNA-binding NarL/FixJ family response regulator
LLLLLPTSNLDGKENALKRRVLLVDDSAIIRLFLARLLRANEFEVCGEAVNGEDAVEKAQRLKPEIIILDLSMPVMNGLQAAHVLQSLMPDVPLLLYTSHAGATLAQVALDAGVSSVVSKSDPVEALLTRLQTLAA